MMLLELGYMLGSKQQYKIENLISKISQTLEINCWCITDRIIFFFL
jgi:hypothetical protein